MNSIKEKRKKIITIDGPAGAGKTTVSQTIAKRLGWIYVDTGALYRGVAFEVKRTGIDWRNEIELKNLLDRIDLDFTIGDDHPVLLSSGEDISGKIRTPEISMLASDVSAEPVVRAALLNIQKNFALKNNAVFEGRDMGTIVFPAADFKFFLSADLKIRALRRYMEMENKEQHLFSLESVEDDMAKRDKNDSIREQAPLKPAFDAVIINSTDMTLNEVVEKMLGIINRVY